MMPPSRILSFLSLLVIFTLLPWQPAVSLRAAPASQQEAGEKISPLDALRLRLEQIPEPAVEPTPTHLPPSEATEPTDEPPYPTPGSEPAPTVTPSLDPAPTPAQDTPFTLEIDDSLATPGGALSLFWQIGTAEQALPGLRLAVSLPAGFQLASGAKGVYDPARSVDYKSVVFLFDLSLAADQASFHIIIV